MKLSKERTMKVFILFVMIVNLLHLIIFQEPAVALGCSYLKIKDSVPNATYFIQKISINNKSFDSIQLNQDKSGEFIMLNIYLHNERVGSWKAKRDSSVGSPLIMYAPGLTVKEGYSSLTWDLMDAVRMEIYSAFHPKILYLVFREKNGEVVWSGKAIFRT